MRCSFLLAAEVDVIKVQYRRAAELVPIVQTLLSTEGTVTVSERINSLVVVGTPEAIQRVHAYLERFDQPVEQVRIRIRFDTKGADAERAVAVRGRYSTDDLSIATGGKKKRRGPHFSCRSRAPPKKLFRIFRGRHVRQPGFYYYGQRNSVSARITIFQAVCAGWRYDHMAKCGKRL